MKNIPKPVINLRPLQKSINCSHPRPEGNLATQFPVDNKEVITILNIK